LSTRLKETVEHSKLPARCLRLNLKAKLLYTAYTKELELTKAN